jgi:hypothetical protein
LVIAGNEVYAITLGGSIANLSVNLGQEDRRGLFLGLGQQEENFKAHKAAATTCGEGEAETATAHTNVGVAWLFCHL